MEISGRFWKFQSVPGQLVMIGSRFGHATCDSIGHVILPFWNPSVRPGWLVRNIQPKFLMKAANLRQPDRFPHNIIVFPNHADVSGRLTVLSPSGARVSKVPVEQVAKAPSRRLMENPVPQSRMAELFALKREEKAPENYVRDALEVFHRRNVISGARLSRENPS